MSQILTIINAAINVEALRGFIERNSFIHHVPHSIVVPKLEFVKAKKLYPDLHIFAQSHVGIYNALNDALKKCKTKYYVVAGCDDVINWDIVLKVAGEINDKSAIITGSMLSKGSRYFVKSSISLHAHKALVVEHSVGSIIATELHHKIGLYNESYEIAADADFILNASKQNIKFYKTEYIFGEYGSEGASTKNYIKGQLELLAIMLKVLPGKGLIFIFFVLLRILRHFLTTLFR